MAHPFVRWKYQTPVNDYMDDAITVKAGSVTLSTGTNVSITGSVSVPAGATMMVVGYLVTKEGTTASGHFDLFNVSGTTILEPLGFVVAAGGQVSQVSNLKDPVTVYDNTTTSAVNVAITVGTANTADTYTASLRYVLLNGNNSQAVTPLPPANMEANKISPDT